MPIETINEELCTGCGTCDRSCPMDVIRINKETKKAEIKYPIDCMACYNCEMFCPEKAVYVTPEKGMPGMLMWD